MSQDNIAHDEESKLEIDIISERERELEEQLLVYKKKLKEVTFKYQKVNEAYKRVNNRYKALKGSTLGRIHIRLEKILGKIRRFVIKLKGSYASETVSEKQISKEQVEISKSEMVTDNIEGGKVYKEVRTSAKKSLITQGPVIMKDPVIMNDVYSVDWEELYYDMRAQICDENYLDKVKPLVENIPDSNGSRFFDKIKYRIGVIADEFIFHTYKDAAEFIYLTPEDYKYDLDYVLIVTAWKGVNGEWAGLGNPKNTEMKKKLYNIIDYYKDLGKKIIYYSKEDPGNYYIFLHIAKRCDYIFTTAEECIEHYQKDTEAKSIRLLGFAINPIIHNPIGMCKHNFDEVFFAGTWWNKKYPERKVDMETVFQSVLTAGKKLKLIDRNYANGKADYFYPVEYLKYVSPAIPHDILQKVHKLYPWAININTSKSSTTMYASRVYELQALGSLIISNHSVGMEHDFPNILVEDGNGAATEALMNFSKEEVYRRRVEGIRRVMTGETVYERMRYLLEVVDEQRISLERTVGVVVPDEDCDELVSMVEKQSYSNRTIIRRNQLNEENYRECDIITFFGKGNEYGEYYLEDMINGFKYTDSDFITKDAHFVNGELIEGIEHDYVKKYKSNENTVFWTRSFSLDELLSGVCKENCRGYSIDHFSYQKKC